MIAFSGSTGDLDRSMPEARFSKRVFSCRRASRATEGRHRPLAGWWSRLSLVVAVAFLAVSTGGGPARAQEPSGLESAVAWLLEQQQDDGGFPGFSGESDPATTVDAVVALASASAAGIDVDLEPALNFLEGHALVIAQTSPGSAAKLALALAAAGVDPRDFASVDPLSIVLKTAESGRIGFGPYDHALGMLALVAAGETVPDAAIAYALETQAQGGGWAFDGSLEDAASDSNTTALMVQALVAAGAAEETAIDDAVSYLFALQEETGAFSYQSGNPADSNSTALVAQALIGAHGEDDPEAQAAIDALLTFQNPNGSLSWMLDPRDENIFSTVQALPALAGRAFPILDALVVGWVDLAQGSVLLAA
jgi:hypothetical protein